MIARAMTRRPAAPTIIAVAGAVLAALWVAVLAWPHLGGWRGPLDGIEAALTDRRLMLAGALAPPTDVVIVALDDATLAAPGAGFPFPRARLAEIVTRISQGQPKALAVDILLLDAKSETDDAALAAAFASVPTVIAAAGRFEDGRTVAGLPETSSELWPLPAFADTASVGLVNIVSDVSGTPRHVPLMVVTSRGLQVSLVLKAAALFHGTRPRIGVGTVAVGPREVAIDIGYHLPLRLAGPGGTVETISARDILNGSGVERLAGRMVVLGFTATAVGDRFPTPFDSVTPGVEILATAIAQLIGASDHAPSHGLVRTQAIRRWDVAAASMLAMGGVAVVALSPISAGVPLAVMALAAWLAAVCVLFAQGYWFSAALPLAGSLPPMLGAALARHLHERALARRSSAAAHALRQFHPPMLADRIAHDPAFLREPVIARMAILFVDLAGFTRMSEAIGLSGTRDLLKSFHSCVAREVGACGGVVLNYMGDGAIAAFGLPESTPTDADNALRAAFALVAAAAALPLGAASESGFFLSVRVGLHYGSAVVSRLGHDTHQQITITGDSVNLASRLMEVAKGEAGAIAVSEDLLGALTAPPARSPDIRRRASIRGRAADVEVALWR